MKEERNEFNKKLRKVHVTVDGKEATMSSETEDDLIKMFNGEIPWKRIVVQ